MGNTIRYYGDVEEAADRHLEHLDAAVAAGAWMVACWRVEGADLFCEYVTWKFPTEDFGPATKQLETLLKEQLAPKEPDPLPLANFIQHVKRETEKSNRERAADDGVDYDAEETD